MTSSSDAATTWPPDTASEVLDLLESLLNKSLVQAEEAGGDVRYELLETVRQYGQERLAAAGWAERLRDRHLAWYLPLVEDAAPHLWSTEEARYHDQLEREHDNVRAALRWAQERGAAEEGLRLAGALGQFWLTRGYLGEGLRLEGALAAGAQGSVAAHAQALTMAGHLASWQGDFGDAVGRLEQGVSLFRALGDTSGMALGLSLLGDALEGMAWVSMAAGQAARAARLVGVAEALREALGAPLHRCSTPASGIRCRLGRGAHAARGRGHRPGGGGCRRRRARAVGRSIAGTSPATQPRYTARSASCKTSQARRTCRSSVRMLPTANRST